MEIGRLEFYATKRDRRGSYFGKIYPFNPSLRSRLDDGLVFFHESCIPRTSALRDGSEYRGYQYATRLRGRFGYASSRTIYASPVYVAFEMPQDPTTRKGDAAVKVMLLKEADPEGLPDLSLVMDEGVKVALITAFPSVFTLSRIGTGIIQSFSQVDQLKACWDGSSDEMRAEFIRSLDPEALQKAFACLVEVDKREDQGLSSPHRSRQALTARPEAALIPGIAARLTPSMWIDEYLAIMRNPDKREALLSSAKPPFSAYALSKLAEAGEPLEDDAADAFFAAVRESGSSDLSAQCLRAVLAAQPNLALRGDVAEALTPALWVEELLDLVRSPSERRTLLSRAQPAFCAYAIARLAEAGDPLDVDDTRLFVAAIGECTDEELAAKCLGQVLSRQPALALTDRVAPMLAPGMWVDGLLSLMERPRDRHAFLTTVRPEFHVYAISRFVETGGSLNTDDAEGFAIAIRKCEDEGLVSTALQSVLDKQPRLALVGGIAETLTPRTWVDGLFELMRTPQEQMALLAPSSPGFRSFAVQKLIEAGADLDIGILTLCPLHSCPALLDRVRWSADDEAYAEAVGHWLREARLCDGEGRRLIVAAAENMHATGDLLSPVMWEHLPAVMRIRLCIFWSNHYSELDDYAVRGGVKRMCVDAYKCSWKGYDHTLKAALLLLALPLSTNPRKAFLDANDALIGEVVRQFNECGAGTLRSFVLGDELQALLQRCASYQYVDEMSVRGFCDGRWWESASAVWCHAGASRPEGGRRKCDSLRPSTNCAGMSGLELLDPDDQFMASLLTNVSDAMGGDVNVGPWLESHEILDLVEYAYRVSGYVNKMAAALPHMVCRGCGARLRLNYEYPRKNLYGESSHRGLSLPALSATVCSCPNARDGKAHDVDVYIHYCLNCHRIIDSRECRMRDSEGYYLCMYCGASKVFKPATACPSCGNTNPRTLRYYTGSLRDELNYLTVEPRSGEVLVVCKARGCKYDAREYISPFE